MYLLPDDLLAHSLSYLDAVHELLPLQRVSRSLSNLICSSPALFAELTVRCSDPQGQAFAHSPADLIAFQVNITCSSC